MNKLIRIIEFYFRQRLRSWCKFEIGTGSSMLYRKISGKNGCQLSVGSSSMVQCCISFDRENSHISIGDRTFIGASNIICAHRIEIGSDVLISWGCTIVDHNSHSVNWNERSHDVVNWNSHHKDWSYVDRKPVKIGDKAWLGFNVIVLKGVTVGTGAIVGAGSVVTSDVAPYTIVAGNPARVIRELSANER